MNLVAVGSMMLAHLAEGGAGCIMAICAGVAAGLRATRSLEKAGWGQAIAFNGLDAFEAVGLRTVLFRRS